MMKANFKKNIAFLSLLFFAVFAFCSCSSDEEIINSDANSELVKEATNYLNGEIVLSTNATMNGVNKTLLPEGCPTKFKFEWNKTDAQTFTISLLDFTVGNMGMIINFKCDVKTMVLNSWEQKEYTGDGWIKFKGEDGAVWGTDTDGSASSAKGSSVQGYYNAKTHEIQFIVNYNMMNVRSECFKQTIDKSRLATFEADKKKYEVDLAAYKKEHGIK
ncbi:MULTISPECIES: DUF4903 domain-containing protein [Segatella]|uniref:DUF4903 domain-containing protein n=2 Tax=Segatella TaxID=2974251 RepID=A0AA37HX04_SEGBR|nr:MULTISPECIES: DUF4903 domain-containing protein [Segatella]EFI70935.1 putative lipoprotein [Segatella baroniae B14]UKK77651.1 DUF4903 domain-containing protein [Segatella baroniae B14]GJG28081.1 DUF4903 domain-containing protein [Segatella bryantii]SEQ94221.1 protein of unknown function [Segatella baroniae B14]